MKENGQKASSSNQYIKGDYCTRRVLDIGVLIHGDKILFPKFLHVRRSETVYTQFCAGTSSGVQSF